MRKFLIGVAALLALLVATALVGPNLVDWNSYKAEILAQAKAATGRDLSIDGNIDFSVFPGLIPARPRCNDGHAEEIVPRGV